MPRKSNWDVIRGEKPSDTIKNRDVYSDQTLQRGKIGKKQSMTTREIMVIVASVFTFLLVYFALGFVNYARDQTSAMLGHPVGTVESHIPIPGKKDMLDTTEAGPSKEVKILHGKHDYQMADMSGAAMTKQTPNLNKMPIRGDWDVINAKQYGFSHPGTDSNSSIVTIGEIKNGTAKHVAALQTNAGSKGVGSLQSYLFSFNFMRFLIALAAGFAMYETLYQLAKRNLKAQNSLKDMSDINQYHNDQHIMLPEEIMHNFEPFPDVGAHSWIQPSSLISHSALTNKGLKYVYMTRRYKSDTYDSNTHELIAYKGSPMLDNNGNRLKERLPMIDTKFMDALFTASGDPKDKKIRKYYDPTKIKFVPQDVSEVGHWKKVGAKTVADVINKDWEIPDYETQRPAGVYWVDTSPVNTMVNFLYINALLV